MLELEDVSHVYGNGTRALDHVTLSIPCGMFGLLGPNGAGKSTLMRTVATLQTPSEGRIRFGNLDVIAEPEKPASALLRTDQRLTWCSSPSTVALRSEAEATPFSTAIWSSMS